ncbi:exodeoxyribonuclease VII large subunit [Alteromonas sp. ALT199]|uniref:hypothetical protein n=1 Tax=unclassified Alteromonas TaxID=2614992 RepID=UPI00046D1A64|nr:hypothetical protein [Alteromonas sp. ALT199]MBT3136871.1 exodeoxyribonuclease VII large subunit [Alteromonas sp. ALT199]
MSVEKLRNIAIPLQKNQMYNWFDRYKPQEQQKIHILNSGKEEKSKLKLLLGKRRRVKKA